MLDRILNPTPTFYKWDRFSVGALPALILPFVCCMLLFVITFLNAKYVEHTQFTLHMFLLSFKSEVAFLRASSLCCMPNAALFFFFIKNDYYNASRGVIITTMLFVIAILTKELL